MLLEVTSIRRLCCRPSHLSDSSVNLVFRAPLSIISLDKYHIEASDGVKRNARAHPPAFRLVQDLKVRHSFEFHKKWSLSPHIVFLTHQKKKKKKSISSINLPYYFCCKFGRKSFFIQGRISRTETRLQSPTMGLFSKKPKPKPQSVTRGDPSVRKLTPDTTRRIDEKFHRTLRDDSESERGISSPTPTVSTSSFRQQATSRSRSDSTHHQTRQTREDFSPYPHVPRNATLFNATAVGQEGGEFEERIIAANQRRIARRAELEAQGIFDGPRRTHERQRTEQNLPAQLTAHSRTVNMAMGGWRGVDGRASGALDIDAHVEDKSIDHGSYGNDVQPSESGSEQSDAPTVSLRPKQAIMRSRMALRNVSGSQSRVNSEHFQQQSPTISARGETSANILQENMTVKASYHLETLNLGVVTVQPPVSQPREDVDRPRYISTFPREPFGPKVRHVRRYDEGYHESISQRKSRKPRRRRAPLNAENLAEHTKREHELEPFWLHTCHSISNLPDSRVGPGEIGSHLAQSLSGIQGHNADAILHRSSKSEVEQASQRLIDVVSSTHQFTINTSSNRLSATEREASEPRLLHVLAKRTPVLVPNGSQQSVISQCVEWVNERDGDRHDFPWPLEYEYPDARIKQWLQRIELRPMDDQDENLPRVEDSIKKRANIGQETGSFLSKSTLYGYPTRAVCDAKELCQAPGATKKGSLDVPAPTETSVSAPYRLLPQLPKLYTEEEALALLDFQSPPLHPQHGNISTVPGLSQTRSLEEGTIPTPSDTAGRSSWIEFCSPEKAGAEINNMGQSPRPVTSLENNVSSPLESSLPFQTHDGHLPVGSQFSGPLCFKEADIRKYRSAEWDLPLQIRPSKEKAGLPDKHIGRGSRRELEPWSVSPTPKKQQNLEASAGHDERWLSMADDNFDSANSNTTCNEKIAPPIPLRSAARTIGTHIHPLGVHKDDCARQPTGGGGTAALESSSRETWSYPHRPNLGKRLGFVVPKRAGQETNVKTKGKTWRQEDEPYEPDEDLILFSDTEA